LAAWLSGNGQALLPMVELIEQGQMVVDEFIGVLGRAGLEAGLADNRGLFCRRKPTELRRITKEIKLQPEHANIAGLQLADVLAHPVKQACLVARGAVPDGGETFGKRVLDAVEEKLSRNKRTGEVEGYGTVWLPGKWSDALAGVRSTPALTGCPPAAIALSVVYPARGRMSDRGCRPSGTSRPWVTGRKWNSSTHPLGAAALRTTCKRPKAKLDPAHIPAAMPSKASRPVMAGILRATQRVSR